MAAPAVRSGTTLVQRLLCSSPRALIYGETCAQDLLTSLSMHTARATMLLYNRDGLNRTLHGVLHGQVNQFVNRLTPDVDGYVEALGRSAVGWLDYCRDYARRAGRPVWGFKYPDWRPPDIDMIRRSLPRARWLYVYRPVGDCVRSAKALGRLPEAADVQAFCQAWRTNLAHVLTWREAPELLLVRYADLLERPRETLERVAAFTGAADMDPTVLAHKINDAGGAYVPPAGLTDGETRCAAEAEEGFSDLLYK